MTRARLVLGLSILLCACPSTRPPPREPVSAGGEVLAAGESSVVTLRRPDAEGVLVQLWIDAGAIDAAEEHGAPELASLASWIAEARAGADVRARVVPDGTVFQTRGASLQDALGRLVVALGARAPTDAELLAAREVLRARRRGRAVDGLAALEAQAASMLLGPADPLGLEPEADGGPEGGPEAREEVELRQARDFLAAHYGPTRARWVVVGDVDAHEVRAAVLRVCASLPLAEHDASSRRIPAEGERTVAREDTLGFAVAYLSPDPSALGGAAGLDVGPGDRHARFPTPCGLLGIASGLGELDGPRLGLLSFALAAGSPREGDLNSDDAADAERAGLAFVARPERCASEPSEGRLAVVIAAPDHPERRLADVDRALDGSRRIEIGHVDVDGHSALVSVVLRGGSLEDPATSHGRAAIVAGALASHCDVSASVTPEAIELTAPILGSTAEGRDASLAATLACLLLRPLPAAFFEASRTNALARLDADALFLSRAAESIAPGTPGLVAPLGSPAGLSGAHELDAALLALRTTSRVAVSVVSPTPPDPAIGRGLGALAGGDAPAATVGEVGPAERFIPSIESTVVELILTVRVDGERARGGADARTVAALLAEELDASPLTVSRFASGSAAGVSWAAIGVTGDDEAIDLVQRHWDDAVERADPRLDAALAEAAAARETEQREDSTRARDVARRMTAPSRPTPDPLAARTLLHAPLHRVVIRPESPPIRRR